MKQPNSLGPLHKAPVHPIALIVNQYKAGIAHIIRTSTENEEKINQGQILGGFLHPIAFTKDDYLLATTRRQSFRLKIALEHPQAPTRQLSHVLPDLELLQLPFRPLPVEQMFVRSFLKPLAGLTTEGRMLLS